MIIQTPQGLMALEIADRGFLKSASALREALMEEYQVRFTKLRKMYGITQDMYLVMEFNLGKMPE